MSDVELVRRIRIADQTWRMSVRNDLIPRHPPYFCRQFAIRRSLSVLPVNPMYTMEEGQYPVP
ncbi:MAG: hypothetical protein ACLTQI_07680 [Slackia sp.]